jgi:hypothetical protein
MVFGHDQRDRSFTQRGRCDSLGHGLHHRGIYRKDPYEPFRKRSFSVGFELGNAALLRTGDLVVRSGHLELDSRYAIAAHRIAICFCHARRTRRSADRRQDPYIQTSGRSHHQRRFVCPCPLDLRDLFGVVYSQSGRSVFGLAGDCAHRRAARAGGRSPSLHGVRSGVRGAKIERDSLKIGPRRTWRAAPYCEAHAESSPAFPQMLALPSDRPVSRGAVP